MEVDSVRIADVADSWKRPHFVTTGSEYYLYLFSDGVLRMQAITVADNKITLRQQSLASEFSTAAAADIVLVDALQPDCIMCLIPLTREASVCSRLLFVRISPASGQVYPAVDSLFNQVTDETGRLRLIPEAAGCIQNRRGFASIGLDDGSLLLSGGLSEAEFQSGAMRLYSDTYKVDFSSSTTTVLQPLPLPLAFHTIDRVDSKNGNRFILLGGIIDKDTCNSTVYEYRASQDRWEALLELPFAPRYNHATFVIKNRYIVVFGGQGANFVVLDDMWVYDTYTYTFASVRFLQVAPTARVQGSLVYNDAEDRLYFMAGKRTTRDALTDAYVIMDFVKKFERYRLGVYSERFSIEYIENFQKDLKEAQLANRLLGERCQLLERENVSWRVRALDAEAPCADCPRLQETIKQLRAALGAAEAGRETLARAVDGATAERDSLQRRHDALVASSAGLQGEGDQYRATIADMASRAAQLEREADALRAALGAAEAERGEIADLQRRLAEAEAEAEAGAQADTQTQALAQAQAELADARAALQAQLDAHALAAQAAQAAQSANETLNGTLNEQAQTLNDLIAKNYALGEAKAEAERAAGDTGRALQEALAEQKRGARSIRDLRRALARQRTHEDQLEQELVRGTGQLEGVLAQVERAKTLLAAKEAEAQQAADSVAELQRARAADRDQLDALARRADALAQEGCAKDVAAETLRARGAELDADAAALRASVERLSSELAHRDVAYANLRRDAEHAKDAASDGAQRVAALEAELTDRTRQVGELQAREQGLAARLDRLHADKRGVDAQLSSAHATLDAERERTQSLVAELGRQQDAAGALVAERSELAAAHAAALRRLEGADAQIAELSAAAERHCSREQSANACIADLNAAVADLRRQLDDKTAALEDLARRHEETCSALKDTASRYQADEDMLQSVLSASITAMKDSSRVTTEKARLASRRAHDEAHALSREPSSGDSTLARDPSPEAALPMDDGFTRRLAEIEDLETKNIVEEYCHHPGATASVMTLPSDDRVATAVSRYLGNSADACAARSGARTPEAEARSRTSSQRVEAVRALAMSSSQAESPLSESVSNLLERVTAIRSSLK